MLMSSNGMKGNMCVSYHVIQVVDEICHKVERPLKPIQRFAVVHNPEVDDHLQIHHLIDLHLLDLQTNQKKKRIQITNW